MKQISLTKIDGEEVKIPVVEIVTYRFSQDGNVEIITTKGPIEVKEPLFVIDQLWNLE